MNGTTKGASEMKVKTTWVKKNRLHIDCEKFSTQAWFDKEHGLVIHSSRWATITKVAGGFTVTANADRPTVWKHNTTAKTQKAAVEAFAVAAAVEFFTTERGYIGPAPRPPAPGPCPFCKDWGCRSRFDCIRVK